MALDLYYIDDSPPCQSVQLVAKALGLKLNLIFVDLWKDEHLKPEFLKINPQHTLPALVDNGLIIVESRAIMCYLVEKYGKDDSLYPKDPKKRATVNSRLYFDMGTLYQRFADLHYPMMFKHVPYDPEKKKSLDEAYGFLNQFLANSPWVAGNTLTIADMTVAVTVANAIGVTGYKIAPYPNVVKWYNNVKASLQGFEEIVETGVHAFNVILDGRKIKRILDE